jgi:hypothetical protein
MGRTEWQRTSVEELEVHRQLLRDLVDTFSRHLRRAKDEDFDAVWCKHYKSLADPQSGAIKKLNAFVSALGESLAVTRLKMEARAKSQFRKKR